MSIYHGPDSFPAMENNRFRVFRHHAGLILRLYERFRKRAAGVEVPGPAAGFRYTVGETTRAVSPAGRSAVPPVPEHRSQKHTHLPPVFLTIRQPFRMTCFVCRSSFRSLVRAMINPPHSDLNPAHVNISAISVILSIPNRDSMLFLPCRD